MLGLRIRTLAVCSAAAAFGVLLHAAPALALPECPLELSGFDAGLHAERFVLADFDHDGVLDVVAVQPNVPFGNGGAVFLRGTHTNGYSLSAPVHFATGDLLEVVTADFDQDGNADVAMLDHTAHQIRVMRGLGNGAFAAPTLYSTEDDPVGLATGDVDRDGITDLLIANGGTSTQLLMGHGVHGVADGTFTSRPGPYTGSHPVSLSVADLDGDLIPDIAVEEQNSLTVALFRGLGSNGIWNGDWAEPVRFALHDQPTYVRLVDIDGDGWRDVVCATYNGLSTVLLGGKGFTFHVDSLLGDAHVKAPFGEADWLHDGRKSLVIADPGESTLRLEAVESPVQFAFDALGTRQLTFGPTVAAACADLDGDGVDDAIAVSRDTSMFSVLLSRCPSLAPLQSAGSGWNAAAVALSVSPGAKSAPRVASDSHGGAYITWSDGGMTPAHVVVQHLLPSGQRDPNFTDGGVVVSPRASAATSPQVVTDGGGGAWVFWDEAPAAGRGIYGAKVLSDGRVPVWWSQFGYADRATGRALAGSFEIREDGHRGWAQAWVSGAGDDARAQLFAGNRDSVWAPGDVGLPVGTPSTPRSEVIVIADAGLGAFKCWRSTDPAVPGVRVLLSRITRSGAGAPGWPAAGVLLAGGLTDRHLLDLAGDGRGGVWVLWNDSRSGTARVFAQHVDSVGAVLGAASGIAVCDRAGTEAAARLVPLASGNAIVVLVNDSGDGGDIVTQVLAGGGVASGAVTAGRTVCAAPGAQTLPVAIADGLGGAFVAWQDKRGVLSDVFATRLDGNAVPVSPWPANGSPLCIAAGEHTAPQMATLGPGQAIVVFSDMRSGVSAPYAARLSPVAPVTGVEDAVPLAMAFVNVSPNPSHGAFALRFVLASHGTAELDVWDISGRRVHHESLGALAAGAHEWHMSGEALPPGVYLARVTQGAASRTARVVVLQ
jgi:hypothetical protein